jgi:hypothetical protein
MPHERRPGSPRIVVERIEGRDALFEVELWVAPSPQWRAAFLRPPPALITTDRTPKLAASQSTGATLHFRTAPRHVGAWLRRIDRWIAYANSVVRPDPKGRRDWHQNAVFPQGPWRTAPTGPGMSRSAPYPCQNRHESKPYLRRQTSVSHRSVPDNVPSRRTNASKHADYFSKSHPPRSVQRERRCPKKSRGLSLP